jgi:hypothetical protein
VLTYKSDLGTLLKYPDPLSLDRCRVLHCKRKFGFLGRVTEMQVRYMLSNNVISYLERNRAPARPRARGQSTCLWLLRICLRRRRKTRSSCGLERVDRVDLEVEMKGQIHSKEYGKVSLNIVAYLVRIHTLSTL